MCAMRSAMREVLRRWDAEVPVTLAIANAGIAAGTRPDGSAEGLEAFRAQIDVNLMGAVHLVEALLPGMRGRGRGRFVLVSSVAAFRGLPDSPGYCASKAALWGYGEAVRAGLAGSGVGMTLVAPGFFDSAMGERWVGARPFSVSAEVAAGKVVRGAERGAAVVAFPWVLGVGVAVFGAGAGEVGGCGGAADGVSDQGGAAFGGWLGGEGRGSHSPGPFFFSASLVAVVAVGFLALATGGRPAWVL
jgi:NAD(P)-dependent dehydrogenase (short-subunit alcohol dehydrogenase family)